MLRNSILKMLHDKKKRTSKAILKFWMVLKMSPAETRKSKNPKRRTNRFLKPILIVNLRWCFIKLEFRVIFTLFWIFTADMHDYKKELLVFEMRTCKLVGYQRVTTTLMDFWSTMRPQMGHVQPVFFFFADFQIV